MIKTKNLILFMPFIGGGGVEKNLYLIANYLTKKINNLNICTLSLDKKKKFNKKINFIVPEKKISFKVNIRIKYLICLFTLFKYLRKNKETVVFSFQANIYCIILCYLLGIKIIVRSNSSPSGWYHNSIKKFIYRLIISKADSVIVNSLDFKKQMQNQFGIKVNCIFNPLNIKSIQKLSKSGLSSKFFKTKKSVLKIINLGRFTDQKDQITILKAANLLKKKIDFRLLILGRGVEKNNLKNFVYKNKLQKFVKIENFVENPFKIIDQSDIFILSSRFEGLPNVLLEAASLKKFIISTNCPTGPKEILLNGKGGLFFKIGDYQDLANKIIFYLKNKKEMKKRILVTYKYLQRYNYNLNMKKYYDLIKIYLKTSTRY